MARGHEKAVRDHEVTIRPVLDRVGSAEDAEFLEVAVEAMQELTSIDSVAMGPRPCCWHLRDRTDC